MRDYWYAVNWSPLLDKDPLSLSRSGSNSKGNVTSKMRSHVERFTARALSYDSDFLIAFVGKSEAL